MSVVAKLNRLKKVSTDPKLDKIIEDLFEIKESVFRNTITLDRNTEDIAKHIQRTDILEDYVKTEVRLVKADLETALIPIKWFKTTFKVVVSLAALTTAIWTLRTLFNKFF